jgi:exosortase F-associated protein
MDKVFSVQRMAMVGAGLLVLILVYLFQGFSYALLVGELVMDNPGALHPDTVFIINKTVRLIVNDLACMLLIFAIFRRKSYLLIALYVFLFELFILLPAYFAIKLSLEGDTEISSPLLSFVHRLIVNPMLMLVLMAGFFYQRRTRL